MTHTQSHIIIDFAEQPFPTAKSSFKRRDLICLILGVVLGWLLL